MHCMNCSRVTHSASGMPVEDGVGAGSAPCTPKRSRRVVITDKMAKIQRRFRSFSLPRGRKKNMVRQRTEISESEPLQPVTPQDPALLSRQATVEVDEISYTLYQCSINVVEGHNLISRDSNGLSDPFVKIMHAESKSRTTDVVKKSLNPTWNSRKSIIISNLSLPIHFRVFDEDLFGRNEPMGSVSLVLQEEMATAKLELDRPQEFDLKLVEEDSTEDCGFLRIEILLRPEVGEELEVHQLTVSPKVKTKPAILRVSLPECHDTGLNLNSGRFYILKFKLGADKVADRIVTRGAMPGSKKCLQWTESLLLLYHGRDRSSKLDFALEEEKGSCLARGSINLVNFQLQPEETVKVETSFVDKPKSRVLFNVALTGSKHGEITALPSEQEDDTTFKQQTRIFSLFDMDKKIFRPIRKPLGWLQVKVLRGKGLPSADINGKSDPLCVIQLGSQMLQTHVEYKTLNPEWNRAFYFPINDIHSVLDFYVYDDDGDKKYEFLGRFSLPLLQIENRERRWYKLKDKTLAYQSKGHIEVELTCVYNTISAALRTINPKELEVIVTPAKFRLSTLQANIERVKVLGAGAVTAVDGIKSIFEWDSPPKTCVAFVIYCCAVWNFEIWMLPLGLLLGFLMGYYKQTAEQAYNKMRKLRTAGETAILIITRAVSTDTLHQDEDDDDEIETCQEKKSIKEKLQKYTQICFMVQEHLDQVVSLVERARSVLEWRVPWLSWLSVFFLTLVTILLYYVPLRILLLAWGVNKFTKKKLRPNAVPNNELMDLLSRAPNSREIRTWKNEPVEDP